MSDLKPWGWHSANLCPKCGDTWHHTFEFCRGAEMTKAGGPRECLGPEYLKVTCIRCGYDVCMAPKDA